MSLFLTKMKQQAERAARLYIPPAPINPVPDTAQIEFDFSAPPSTAQSTNTVVFEETAPAKKINKKKAK